MAWTTTAVCCVLGTNTDHSQQQGGDTVGYACGTVGSVRTGTTSFVDGVVSCLLLGFVRVCCL